MTEPKERTRTVVSGFEEWTSNVKSEVLISRPDGDYIIPIRAVSEAGRSEITAIYKDLTPPMPHLTVDKKTGERRDSKLNDDAEKEYDRKKRYASEVVQMLYIERGCGWTIPGNDYTEKLKSLGDKVSGEVDRLYAEILKISRLTNENIGYF